jgi:hypothetical protein
MKEVESRRRSNPEFLGEDPHRVSVSLQSTRDIAAEVERTNELLPRAITERIVAYEASNIGNQAG